MVRQAGKGLDADHVWDAGADKLDHFAGEEPALTVLIADREEGLGDLGDVLDRHGRLEAAALLKGADRRLAEHTQKLYGEL